MQAEDKESIKPSKVTFRAENKAVLYLQHYIHCTRQTNDITQNT
jgi:hypothetical protein